MRCRYFFRNIPRGQTFKRTGSEDVFMKTDTHSSLGSCVVCVKSSDQSTVGVLRTIKHDEEIETVNGAYVEGYDED